MLYQQPRQFMFPHLNRPRQQRQVAVRIGDIGRRFEIQGVAANEVTVVAV